MNSPRVIRTLDRLQDMLLVFMLLGAPLIFYTKANDVFEFNKITALRFASCLSALVFGVKAFLVRRPVLTRSPLDWPVLSWLLVSVVCTFNTVNIRLSVHGVYEDFEGITTLVNYAYLFWLAQQHVRTERQIHLVIGSVVLAGAAAGFYGILQNFRIDFVPWDPATYSVTRMFSTMGNPNFLAAYLVMSLPITLAVFLDLPRKVVDRKAAGETDEAGDRRVNDTWVLLGLGLVMYLAFLLMIKLGIADTKVNPADPDGALMRKHPWGVPLFFGGAISAITVGLIFAAVRHFKLRFTSRPLVLSPVGLVVLTLGLTISIFLVWLFKIDYFGSTVDAAKSGFDGAWYSQKFLAAHLLPLFPMAAALLLLFGQVKLILLLSMIFQVVAIAFAKSRGGGLAMLFLGLIFSAYFIWEVRRGSDVLKKNAVWLISFAVLVVAAHFIKPIRETTFHMVGRIWDLTDPEHFKLTPRLYIWRSAAQMWADKPAFGWGLDTFQVVFSQYRTALYWNLEWNGTPEKAHNIVMQTAATMGTMGLLTFFWLLVSYLIKTLKDLRKLADSRQRLLIVACFAASAAFLLQDLFSFTVVGYGSLFWVLLGFGPAMSRTWLQAQNRDFTPRPLKSRGLHPALAAVVLVGVVLVWFGPRMQPPTGGAKVFLGLMVLCGMTGLWLAWRARRIEDPVQRAERNWLAGPLMLVPCLLGYTFFAFYSVKTWAADSLYKQGQIGNKLGKWVYAATMLNKAAGGLENLNTEQAQSMMRPVVPEERLQIKIKPGMNPDQELYWVKLGIAYETGAAEQTDKNLQQQYYLTALAMHQHTVEMSPVNGYNYNNKARVLKSMGEKLGNGEYFKVAKAHYDKSLEMDSNNFYFNIESINNDINLEEKYPGEGWLDQAYEKCNKLIEGFPDVALPYSYRGFIELRRSNAARAAGKIAEADALLDKSAESFSIALSKDWKHDRSSRGLAGANLALLMNSKAQNMLRAGNQTGAAEAFAEAAKGYGLAADAFPDQVDHRVNQSKMLWASGQKEQARAALESLRGRYDQNQWMSLKAQMACP